MDRAKLLITETGVATSLTCSTQPSSQSSAWAATESGHCFWPLRDGGPCLSLPSPVASKRATYSPVEHIIRAMNELRALSLPRGPWAALCRLAPGPSLQLPGPLVHSSPSSVVPPGSEGLGCLCPLKSPHGSCHPTYPERPVIPSGASLTWQLGEPSLEAFQCGPLLRGLLSWVASPASLPFLCSSSSSKHF